MKLKAKVFADATGNRMIFPAYMYPIDADNVPTETEFWSKATMIRAATGLVMEPGWLEFDDMKFPTLIQLLAVPALDMAVNEFLFSLGRHSDLCDEVLVSL